MVARVHSQYWAGRSVLVAGGCGFIGSHLVRALVLEGARVRVADNLSHGTLKRISDVADRVHFMQLDLCNPRAAFQVCADIDTVFQLAACARGITYAMRHHAKMLYNNLALELQLLEASRRQDVQRFIFFSSSAVYPSDAPVPTAERFGFDGVPHPASRGYAWAKRVGELQAEMYRTDFGMSITRVRPFNVCGSGEHYYGTGLHVIPALIRRAHSAQRYMRVLGSGQQTRSFVDAADLAALALVVAEMGGEVSAINISSPHEVSVADICKIVLAEMGKHDLKINFVREGAVGAMRCMPDLTALHNLIGAYKFVPLEDSIRRMTLEYKELSCGNR